MASIITAPPKKYIVHPAILLAGGLAAALGAGILNAHDIDVFGWSWETAGLALFAFGQVVLFGGLAYACGYWEGTPAAVAKPLEGSGDLERDEPAWAVAGTDGAGSPMVFDIRTGDDLDDDSVVPGFQLSGQDSAYPTEAEALAAWQADFPECPGPKTDSHASECINPGPECKAADAPNVIYANKKKGA